MILLAVDHPDCSVLKHTRSPTPYSLVIGADFRSIALATLRDKSSQMNALRAVSRTSMNCENSCRSSAIASKIPKSNLSSDAIPGSLHCVGVNPLILLWLFFVDNASERASLTWSSPDNPPSSLHHPFQDSSVPFNTAKLFR